MDGGSLWVNVSYMGQRMTFTEKLSRLTEDRTKTKVSRRAGLHPTAISNYLVKGCVPRGDIALRIARAIGVSAEWMLDDAQGWPPVWVNAPEPASPRTARRRARQVA
jgi:hypothetical protein